MSLNGEWVGHWAKFGTKKDDGQKIETEVVDDYSVLYAIC